MPEIKNGERCVMGGKKKRVSYSQKWINTVKRHNRAPDLGKKGGGKTKSSSSARKKKK
jgi:hypothetical protein